MSDEKDGRQAGEFIKSDGFKNVFDFPADEFEKIINDEADGKTTK